MTTPTKQIDITSYKCPMTFVRTKLAIEELAPGDVLSVRLRGSEPLRNVPRAVEDHGSEIIAQKALGDDIYEIWIRIA